MPGPPTPTTWNRPGTARSSGRGVARSPLGAASPASERSARPARRCDRRRRATADRAGRLPPSSRAAPGSARRRSTSARRRSGVELVLGHDSGAAGVAESTLALAVWWSSVASGHGTRIEGSTDGRQLGHGGGPGARQHEVGGGVGEVHPVFVARQAGTDAVGARLRRGRRPGVVARSPTTWRTARSAGGRDAATRPATTSLSLPEPSEPPTTSRMKRSAGSPSAAAGGGPVAGPVDAEDLVAQRGAGDRPAGQRRARRRRRRWRPPGGLPARLGGAGARVVADDHDRYPQRRSGQDRTGTLA